MHVCERVHVCVLGHQPTIGPQPCQCMSGRFIEVGMDCFYDGLRSFLGRGRQAGVRLRRKTSVFRGAVTWICPQLSVLLTHVKF